MLTGGIGSGKSTVARIFSRFGACVIDTDEISHFLTGKNGAALSRIAENFGAEFILDDSLDRTRMRQRVFSDPESKKRLESILHPMIREEVERRIEKCDSPYYLLVVPLFFETGHYFDLADRVLVVDCGEEKQVERVAARSGLSADMIHAIMGNQVSRTCRLDHADDILENGGEMDELEKAAYRLHCQYLDLINRS